MPTRIDVWDREALKAIPMFSGDATDAVANDPARYTLDIPADGEPSPPPRREPDAMAGLLAGPSTGERYNDRSSHSAPHRRRPNRRRVA